MRRPADYNAGTQILVFPVFLLFRVFSVFLVFPVFLEKVQKKSGVELLSHTLMCSIIVAGPLNNRVRDGNVCCKTAVNTGKIGKEGRKTDVGNKLDD